MSKIVVRCGNEWLSAVNLKILRQLTALGFSEITRRIKNGEPIAEFTLFLNDYDEIKALLSWFASKAEENSLSYTLYQLSERENFSDIDKPENYKISRSMLQNIFSGSENTRRQLEREDELRFGGSTREIR